MAILNEDDEENKLTTDAGQGAAAPGTSQAAQGSAAPKYTQSSFTSGKKLLQKNMQTGSPNLTKGFEDRAAKSAAEIGTKGQEYKAGLGQKRQEYQVGDEDINKAITGGDQDQFSRLKNILKGPGDIKAFNYRPDLDIQEINRLQTEAGATGALKEQARGRGDYSYNQGQAGLDAYLFGKAPGGRKEQMGRALEKRSDVMSQAEAENAAQEQERQAALTDIGKSVTGLKSSLTGRHGQLTSQAQSSLAAQQQAALQAEKARSSNELYEQAKIAALQRSQELSGNKKYQEAFNPISEYLRSGEGASYGSLGGSSSFSGRDEYGKTAEDYFKGGDLQKGLYSQMMSRLNAQKGDIADVGLRADDAYYDENTSGQFNRLAELLGSSERQESDVGRLTEGGKLGSRLDEILGSGSNLDDLRAMSTKAQKASSLAKQRNTVGSLDVDVDSGKGMSKKQKEKSKKAMSKQNKGGKNEGYTGATAF